MCNALSQANVDALGQFHDVVMEGTCNLTTEFDTVGQFARRAQDSIVGIVKNGMVVVAVYEICSNFEGIPVCRTY